MKTCLWFFTAYLSLHTAQAASVRVNWSVTSENIRSLRDSFDHPLSAGTAASGDGTLLELGYYSDGMVSDPFSGTWTVLATTTMGDDGVNINGHFATSSILGANSDPFLTVNTSLSIRFYDGTSVATSQFYNAVSNTTGAWNYQLPNDPAPVINMVIDKDASIVFEDGLFTVFQTRIPLPIPEPTHWQLESLGASLMLMRRHRRN